MIQRESLLSDLRGLLKTLEDDLLARSESDEVPDVRAALEAEYNAAMEAERTALNYEDWRSDFITQLAAAWVLTCVFVRFLEDNELIESPKIAGPADRLQWARDQYQVYITKHPTETDREYLLDVFSQLRDLGNRTAGDVFGEHNVLWQLPNWLSGDAAGVLLEFFRRINPDTGKVVHDFTDPEWDTRFLGDLYQDLSEKARKKYALLQTPDFVEEFILDRTLEPALDEFGLQPPLPEGNARAEHDENAGLFKMIDPACGSGHFLLGSFPRILRRWREREPGTDIRELVQRSLNSIHGVDINPFAIAIARFRLLLAALAACGVKRLADAPAFAMNLACGDSLYHGVERQQTLGDWTDESHYFRTEDAENLRRILKEGTFHAVVANPPYITPKDKAANQAYRRLYSSCKGKYALSIPFMERIFRLACRPASAHAQSGFTGQITANTFMKREFGKKLIEEYFGEVELTHVVDASGAYIPGHGTPTVILFGRNRSPVAETLRTVMGIIGEPTNPKDPSNGVVWTAIRDQIDVPGSKSLYISVNDTSRRLLAKHPWSIGGGGAAELKEKLDSESTETVNDVTASVGVMAYSGDDDVLVGQPIPAWRRRRIPRSLISVYVTGDHVRDWGHTSEDGCLFPCNPNGTALQSLPDIAIHFLWPYRVNLQTGLFFGKTKSERGMNWYEYAIVMKDRFATTPLIHFAAVSTHNNFAITTESVVCNRHSPVVSVRENSSETLKYELLTFLCSSTVCFWLKQIGHNKGDSTDQRGARTTGDPAFNTYEYSGAMIEKVPVPRSLTCDRSRTLYDMATQLKLQNPDAVLNLKNAADNTFEPSTFECVQANRHALQLQMIRLQEDLDWECYRLYGLLEADLTYPTEASLGIQLGERAFEIVLACKMARGEVQSTWFERHGSTPITEIPDHWPDDYKQLVQRRIDVIESNSQIALIEKPEYKRRWNTTPWEEQVEKALKSWLLDRLESYFDFDGRMNDEGKATAQIDISLISVAKLADIARQDEQFMEVAEVYRDDPAFDVQRLVEELVKGEHVPLLPVLRYKPAGLRKRAEWEKTWQLQRLEDKLRAGEDVRLSDYELTGQQRDDIAGWQQSTPENQRADDRALDAILSIPVPPKYKSSDFISSGGARYWALRGKLDVPKERWVSFPHCEGSDGTLTLAWAGYDHLQQARAISAHYIDIRDNIGGSDDPRLVPLLACLIELLPWLHQWHNEIDPEFDLRMNEYYENFVTTEAGGLGLSREDIIAWKPPERVRKKKATKKRTKKKVST